MYLYVLVQLVFFTLITLFYLNKQIRCNIFLTFSKVTKTISILQIHDHEETMFKRNAAKKEQNTKRFGMLVFLRVTSGIHTIFLMLKFFKPSASASSFKNDVATLPQFESEIGLNENPNGSHDTG